QGAAEILRMQEQHRLAVRTNLGFAVAQHARALHLQYIARGANIRHFITDMMDSAVRVLLQEFSNRRVYAKRFKQFDLGIRQRNENRRDTVIGLRDLGRDTGAHDIAHRDGDMIETADHFLPHLAPAFHHTVKTWTWHMGFLPHRSLTAARTARRIDSATASGSPRRLRGKDSNVAKMASSTASCIEPPSRSRSGMPIMSSSGSAASSPLSVIASATDTLPAKLKRRRSATVRASASTKIEPSL